MKCTALLTIFATFFATAFGFAPVHKTFVNDVTTNSLRQKVPAAVQHMPVSIRNQRYSVAQVQTMSLFGLGGPEIAIILIAAAFLLGPQKLAELGKDAGKIAGELKEVPKEFQKGLEEGEAMAQSTKKEIEADIVSKKEE